MIVVVPFSEWMDSIQLLRALPFIGGPGGNMGWLADRGNSLELDA